MTEQHPKRPQMESISQNSTPSWNMIREYSNLCSPEEMVRILIRRQMEHSENSMADASNITSPKRINGEPPNV